ncbi:transposase [candidate division CSSED10-310 bacterium]|uniref:Transposase n=1 Tax=candidate division CSSED10-310 bacterium TaxID=2855610 RepID=A0ABV6Z6L6_UNCC1
MTPRKREEILEYRKLMDYPWHSPPHTVTTKTLYHLSAACFEHKHIIGYSPERMALFAKKLLVLLDTQAEKVLAWCVLPNHYHALIQTMDLQNILYEIGKMHGRLSNAWNREENSRGRKCWYRCTDRAMRTKRHKLVTLNYINHNPVHHRYVTKWDAWPFSSAGEYLKTTPHDIIVERWKKYPLLDFGKGWDDPDL